MLYIASPPARRSSITSGGNAVPRYGPFPVFAIGVCPKLSVVKNRSVTPSATTDQIGARRMRAPENRLNRICPVLCPVRSIWTDRTRNEIGKAQHVRYDKGLSIIPLYKV